MKKRLCAALFFAALLFCGLKAAAFAGFDSLQKATLTGRGILYVKADKAVLSFCLKATGDSKSGALSALYRLEAAAKESCGDSGQVLSEGLYEYSDPYTGKFTAEKYVTVVTEKLNQTEAIAARLCENDGITLNYVNYFADDTSRYKDKVLAAAIADAVSKASAIDSALAVAEISDLGITCYSLEPFQRSEKVPVAVEANVTVVFTKK